MRAELKFPTGHTGTVNSSMWSIGSLLRISAKAIGSDGEMRVFNPLAPQFGHRLSVRAKGTKRVERFGKRASYAYQLDAFTAAVLNGTPFPTTPEDAIANMTVIDDIYRAAGLEVRQPAS